MENPEDNNNLEEVDTAQTASMATDTPKVKNNKKYAIWAVIVLLAVVLIVVVTIVLLNNRDNQGLVTDDDWSVVVEEDTTPNKGDMATEDDLRDKLTPDEQVKAIVERIKTKIATKGLVISENNYAPGYRTEGMKAFTNLDKGIGIEVGTSQDDETTQKYLMGDAFMKLVIDELIDAGFEGYYNSSDVWDVGSYLNAQTGVVCQMAFRTFPFTLGCGHTSWLSEEKKNMVDELAEAMEMADYKFGLQGRSMITVMENTLENSEYKLYQRMRAGLSVFNAAAGGAAGLFYRTSPEAKWQFFAAVQGPMNCTDYNTEDLKRAFVGSPCWNESKKMDDTVKL